MKLKEVIVEYDESNVPLYRRIGIDTPARNAAEAKKTFINRFLEYIKQNKASIKAAGMGAPDIERMAQTYLTKYNWHADPEQQAIIKKLSDEALRGNWYDNSGAVKLANYMYSVGSQQFINPRTGVAMGDPSAGGAGGSGGRGGAGGAGGAGGQTTPDVRLEPNSVQAIKLIDKMSSKDYVDDLSQVTKIAMAKLYKLDPQKYKDLYQEVMTGQTKKSPEQIRKEKMQQLGQQDWEQNERGKEMTTPTDSGAMTNMAGKLGAPADTSAGAGAFSSMNKSLGGPETIPPEQTPGDTRSQKFDKAAMTARAGMTDTPAPTDYDAKRAQAAKNAQAGMKPKFDPDDNPNIVRGANESRRFYRR